MHKITAYHCDYCKRHTVSPYTMIAHEKVCMMNPETRSCGTCENRIYKPNEYGISIMKCILGLMVPDPKNKRNPWGMRTQCEGYVKKHENEM